jgi:methyl-accepting chemotaxis protein
MDTENGRHKRKKYFIKKDFQFRFILKFCSLVLVGVIVSTALLVFFSKGSLTSSFENSQLVIKNTASAILPAVIYTNLITLGLISIAAVTITLFVSHKIAGPMYRFENELKEISQGNLTKHVQLRNRDQMTDIVNQLNEMVSGLNARISGIRSEVDRLVQVTDAQDLPVEVRNQVKELQKRMNDSFTL